MRTGVNAVYPLSEGSATGIAITTPWLEKLAPTASQVVALGQATPSSIEVPRTRAGPGVPLVIGITTPYRWLLLPTATQVVAVGQATARSPSVPEASCTAPGVPPVIGTTTPWSEGWPNAAVSQVVAAGHPTATQVVAPLQATPASELAPVTASGVPGVPSVIDTTTPWAEALTPTATQVVAVGQATPRSTSVPATT